MGEGIPPGARRGRQNSAIDIQKFAAGAVTADMALDFPARGFILHTAGVLAITTLEGTDVSFAAGELTVGVIYPIEATHVLMATAAGVSFLK